MKTETKPKESGIRRLQKVKQHGNASAMVPLGYLREEGIGVRQDYREAGCCYRRAIKAGDPMGMLFLGQLYQFGRGVKVDGKKAAVLFKKAHRRGISIAAIHLANLYDGGLKNLRSDKRLAIYWYKIAVLRMGHGDKLAKERLSQLMKS